MEVKFMKTNQKDKRKKAPLSVPLVSVSKKPKLSHHNSPEEAEIKSERIFSCSDGFTTKSSRSSSRDQNSNSTITIKSSTSVSPSLITIDLSDQSLTPHSVSSDASLSRTVTSLHISESEIDSDDKGSVELSLNSTNNDDSISLDSGKVKDKRIRPNSYKAYHRDIEKQRRNKINSMITEIAALVPMCQNVSHRLDKLSVLELAVQHMRMITKSSNNNQDSQYLPPTLTEDDLKLSMENKDGGFLIVLSCDKAHILYISDTVSSSTSHTPAELVGRSLLEIVNPKDVSAINDSLSPYNSLPVVGELDDDSKCITGSKRSFAFRLKSSKQLQFDTSMASSSTRYQHTIPGKTTVSIQCDGFLKSWQTNDLSGNLVEDKVKLSTFSCFIGIAKPINVQNGNVMNPQLTTRPQLYSSTHSADSKYLSVDQRVLPISGYLPQDLVGNCEYTFVHKDDIKALTETYRLCLENKHQERVISGIYRLKMKHGGLLPMRTVAFSLFNPFTKKLEFISHQNYVMGNQLSTENIVISKENMSLNRLSAIRDKCEEISRIHDASANDTSGGLASAITPLTMNVLKESGVDTDMLNTILSRQHCVTINMSHEHDENNEDDDDEQNDVKPCYKQRITDHQTESRHHQQQAKNLHRLSSILCKKENIEDNSITIVNGVKGHINDHSYTNVKQKDASRETVDNITANAAILNLTSKTAAESGSSGYGSNE